MAKSSVKQLETGVVLWSDATRGIAVIWCADQGRLVYFASDGPDVPANVPVLGGGDSVKVGDLVSFKSRLVGGMRIVGRVSVIAGNWHPELAEALRDEACGGAQPSPPRPQLRLVG